MADLTASAPSTGTLRLQTSFRGLFERIEARLDAERDQLPLWLPVALGTGVAAWFMIPGVQGWIAFLSLSFAIALSGVALGGAGRLGRLFLIGGLAMALGCGMAWHRAESVRAPVLDRPGIFQFSGKILRVEQRGEDGLRLLIAPNAGSDLPEKVRVTIAPNLVEKPPLVGQIAHVRARLMPPAEAMVPGAYDFARIAWFQGLGATGKAIDFQVTAESGQSDTLRDRLGRHIISRVNPDVSGIASALVTGDRGAIAESDEEAMRNAGLAHLLSISGLHITAVVAAAMFLSLRLLALSETLALRFPLVTISAGFGALAGIGYTLLTGSEVPTVRSCIAAILVLAGLAMGREALTLRLVATGAIIVLLLWPEALVGPSFQLSFAAITAIVALHENQRFRRLVEAREEARFWRFARAIVSLLVTGIVVEVALTPFALFHFHKAGLYGALANIVGIPLTTFVIMPLEALGLAFDSFGAGAPFWWLTNHALGLLLGLAHKVSAMPGAVAMLPEVPRFAFGAILGGGLWIMLWRTGWRWMGVLPLAIGFGFAITTSPPDLLVTGDGKHMAVRDDTGRYAILRPRAGDFVRDILTERTGLDVALDDLDTLRNAKCSPDICVVSLHANGRTWRILATRSRDLVPWRPFIALCAEADIVISDRKLPEACQPRWFKSDRLMFAQTGGLSLHLSTGRVETVRRAGGAHPWLRAKDAAAN